jgi:hypothetical protein
MKHILTIAFVGCTLARVAAADSWGPPKVQEVFSSDKRFRAVVEPEKGAPKDKDGATLTLWELHDGSSKRRYQRRTVNRWSPVRTLVADDGTVVTLDDWLGTGYDHAVVIYAPSGKVVRDSKLDDLLTGEDLKKVEPSVSSRQWYYPAEPPRILLHKLELTAVWGPSLTIDLSSGEFSRGDDRFSNLVQFVKGDLASLDSVEYERWSEGKNARCGWQKDETTCEPAGPDGKATAPTRAEVPRAELRGGFLPVLELLDTVESPTYCAVGCTDQRELRLFFRKGGKEYSYSIVLRNFSRQARPKLNLFEKMLHLLAFDDTGPRSRAVQQGVEPDGRSPAAPVRRLTPSR